MSATMATETHRYEVLFAGSTEGRGFYAVFRLANGKCRQCSSWFASTADANRRAVVWDIFTGLVMLICRFVPIIAPIALAASLARKKSTPFTTGTLRTDTVTFGFVLLGTIILVGALLFLPVAALGPVAEHLGPLPFGG